MLHISSPQNIETYKVEIEEFFTIYKNIFQDAREDEEKIIGRIQNNSLPKTNIVIEELNNKVIGGMIYELYCENTITLLTYIFKSNDCEVKGVAQKLLSSLESQNSKFIFFESLLKIDDRGNILLSDIYNLFKNKDVYKLDIKYYEPITKSIEDYVLCVWNKGSNNIKDELDVDSFKKFLEEFYREYRGDMNGKMVRVESLDRKDFRDKFNLLPKLILPKLQFKKASIALHYVQDIKSYEDLAKKIDETIKKAKEEQKPFCKVFNSFENDLFSLKYVEDQPYFSKNFKGSELIIQFQNNFKFISEGRGEMFVLVDSNKKPLQNLESQVWVHTNFTYFKKSKIIVWEFVITPKTFFNEYELIQLTKLYTGKQENYTDTLLKDNVKKEFCTIINEVLKNYYDYTSEAAIELEAGTVQVDTSSENLIVTNSDNKEQSWKWDDVYQYFNSDNKKDEKNRDRLSLIYNNKEQNSTERTEKNDIQYILNTICGIALGIFDFERMTFEEVVDTITPSTTTDSYFVQLNKNAINCFCIDNKIYNEALKQGIGINPYLIIPNSVLAHNSYISSTAEKKINEKISLQEKIDRIQEYLSNEVLNVFQYETEIRLYDEGMQKRGILEKKDEINKEKEELVNEKSKLNENRNFYVTTIAITLSIISLTQVYEFIDKVISLFKKRYNFIIDTEYIPLYSTLFVALIFTGLFVLLVHRTRDRG